MNMRVALSAWEREVQDHFKAHADAEGKMLGQYRKLAESGGSEALRYVVGMILEDEERHHRLFRELDNAILSTVERGHDPQVPTLDREPHPDEMLAITEQLLAFERKDAKELRKLRKKLRSLEGYSLWPMLVELVELDTEKHIRILRFVRDRLRRQP